VSGTAEEVRAMLAGEGDRTDWARVQAMPQEEVERLADEEDGPLPEGWANSIVVGIPPRGRSGRVRVDADILAWFRAAGPDYQGRFNAALRAFVEAKRGARP